MTSQWWEERLRQVIIPMSRHDQAGLVMPAIFNKTLHACWITEITVVRCCSLCFHVCAVALLMRGSLRWKVIKKMLKRRTSMAVLHRSQQRILHHKVMSRSKTYSDNKHQKITCLMMRSYDGLGYRACTCAKVAWR